MHLFLVVMLSLYADFSISSDKGFFKSENAEQLNGRSYYLLNDGYSCAVPFPKGNRVRSWEDHIEFSDGQVLIWHTLCNDNPIIEAFSDSDIKVSEDLNFIIYKNNTYQFYQNAPHLCKDGVWCPIDKE